MSPQLIARPFVSIEQYLAQGYFVSALKVPWHLSCYQNTLKMPEHFTSVLLKRKCGFFMSSYSALLYVFIIVNHCSIHQSFQSLFVCLQSFKMFASKQYMFIFTPVQWVLSLVEAFGSSRGMVSHYFKSACEQPPVHLGSSSKYGLEGSELKVCYNTRTRNKVFLLTLIDITQILGSVVAQVLDKAAPVLIVSDRIWLRRKQARYCLSTKTEAHTAW